MFAVHRALGRVQLLSHLAVGQPVAGQAQDLALPAGQRVQPSSNHLCWAIGASSVKLFSVFGWR